MLEFRTSDKETEADASRYSIKENLQKLFRKVVQKAFKILIKTPALESLFNEIARVQSAILSKRDPVTIGFL